METFNNQIAASSVPNLLRVAMAARTEMFTFYESPQDVIDDALGKRLLLSEFSRDPKLALCHGIGKGHSFIQVSHLRELLTKVSPKDITDYSTLVKLFRAHGYTVKRIDVTGPRREMAKLVERPPVPVVGCIVVTAVITLIIYGCWVMFF